MAEGRYVSPEGRKVRAEAELAQAATRHARAAGEAELPAARRRLGAAYGKAERAGISRDEAYRVADRAMDLARGERH